MDNKYRNAVIVLGEILLEVNNDLKWKSTLLDEKNKEIEKLKMKLEYIEQYIDNSVSNRK